MHIIGIVGRVYKNKDNQDIIQTHDAVRRMINANDDLVCITILPTEDINYFDYLDGKDIVNSKIDTILDKCDGFIVPGGTYSFNLDEYVINYAIRHDKPLLGICLGFQAMCSLFAKSRNRFDMTNRLDNDRHHGKPDEYLHKVSIKDNTLLRSIIGSEMIQVNSLHHDIVDFELNDLVINATSDDGIIEGVELPNKKFILGLQWHPEYLRDDNTKKIMDRFISELGD